MMIKAHLSGEITYTEKKRRKTFYKVRILCCFTVSWCREQPRPEVGDISIQNRPQRTDELRWLLKNREKPHQAKLFSPLISFDNEALSALSSRFSHTSSCHFWESLVKRERRSSAEKNSLFIVLAFQLIQLCHTTSPKRRELVCWCKAFLFLSSTIQRAPSLMLWCCRGRRSRRKLNKLTQTISRTTSESSGVTKWGFVPFHRHSSHIHNLPLSKVLDAAGNKLSTLRLFKRETGKFAKTSAELSSSLSSARMCQLGTSERSLCTSPLCTRRMIPSDDDGGNERVLCVHDDSFSRASRSQKHRVMWGRFAGEENEAKKCTQTSV